MPEAQETAQGFLHETRKQTLEKERPNEMEMAEKTPSKRDG